MEAVATLSVLPALLVAWPLLAALAVPFIGRSSRRARDGWMILVTATTLLGVLALAMEVMEAQRIHARVPLLLGHLEFTVDHFGALFALFSSFVWFAATLYSLAYLRAQPGQGRYHAVSLFVLAANLGVVFAGNLVTLFLFFETMGLAAFLLVVHAGTVAAKRAAIQYFWMTLLGGAALLAGIMVVHSLGGGDLAPLPYAAGTGRARAAAAALLLVGFGVKAGVAPVHVWLPNAHPVAPTPASALLSGVMIKAGAYGIFRTVAMLFSADPGGPLADPSRAFSSQLGLVVLWLGIVTMAVGVMLALGQRDMKRMLAYHSISQMGFILAGVGAGGYLAADGAMGTAGGLMHTVNHALFKASLFLGAGAVAFRAGGRDMYELGGLWRRMPVTFVMMVVAAAGISGVPMFNGFVSKCLIHHALETAAMGGGPGLKAAERVYVLVCAGTAASFIKLIGLVFLRPMRRPALAGTREAPIGMLLAMALLSAPVIVLGLRPGLLLESMVMPGLQAWSLPRDGVRHFLEYYFLSAGDVRMAAAMLGMGALIVAAGTRLGLFHMHMPPALGPDYWFRRAASGTFSACRMTASGYARLQQRLAWLMRSARRRFFIRLRDAGQARRRLSETLLAGLPGSAEQAFMDAAWVALEEERQATVRAASVAAESARAIAGLLAGALFEARIEALLAEARRGGVTALRAAFAALHPELARSRDAVADSIDNLVESRRRDGDIARLAAAALTPLSGRERLAMRHAAAAYGAEGGRDDATRPGPGGWRAWAWDLGRLVVAELRQPPSAWPRSETADTDASVVAARRRIQHYARDIGLNVAAIFMVLALFSAMLYLAGSG
jgi:formate hydrogenlyase subunit 3/multisubunit Na+/H+ antiporter MnhD subunit